MKTPTSTLQTLIDTGTGTQPTYIVRIDWPTPKYYSMYLDAACDADPVTQLRSISTAALRVNASTTANIDSIRAVLVDTDGTLLTNYKTYGIKGRIAAVYLSYIGEDIADFLMIVEGKVTGGVIWDTDDNSLSIEITTRFDDALIGYSTNTLADMHHEAKDQAWPLVFGSPLRVPALHIKRQPIASLSSGINQNYGQLKISGAEDFPTGSTIKLEINNIRMTGTLAGDTFTAVTMNDPLHTNVGIDGRRTSDPSYNDAAVIWLDYNINIEGLFCYVNDGGDFQMVNYCAEQRGKKCIFARPWGIRESGSSEFSAISEIRILSESSTIAEVSAVPRASWPEGYSGPMTAHTYHPIGATGKDVVVHRHTNSFQVPREWFSLPAGALVHLIVDYDDVYICNLVASSSLLEVWGEVKDDEVDMRPIPSSYYTFYQAGIIDGKTCTALTMSTPLVARLGEKWTGKIWTTVVSTKGPNGVDALRHMIDTYSTYTDDSTTFTSVAVKIAGWPANFALLEKVPLLKTLREIAFQLRCGLIFRGSTILIKYISEAINAQYNLTDASIIDEGMIFNYDTSLFRATSLKARWQLDYTGRKNYQRESTYENNIDVQLLEEEFNFYIYNIKILVDATLAFWGYRFSNLWRIVELKAPLDSAVLEAFDIVDVNTGDFSIHTIRGEVRKVDIDTTNNLVTLRTLMASTTALDRYDIVSIIAGPGGSFIIKGYQLHVFSNGDSIILVNDGNFTFTVNGTPVYDPVTDTTTIKVAENVPTSAINGYLIAAPTQPKENPYFFIGDPSLPITSDPVINDPSEDIEPAQYLKPEPTTQPGDPGDPGGGDPGDPGGGTDNSNYLNVTEQPPILVERGVKFRFKVSITDSSGNPINTRKTITLILHGPDTDDAMDVASVVSSTGEYDIEMTISGGSGNDDENFIEIIANNADSISTNYFSIRDALLTTLRFDVHPTAITRDTNFTVSITGGGDGTVLFVGSGHSDNSDDLYDNATGLAITSITLDSDGEYDSTQWRVSGGLSTTGYLSVHVTDVADVYNDAYFNATVGGTVTATVVHDIGFADKTKGNYLVLVVTTCPTFIPQSPAYDGSKSIDDQGFKTFTMAIELQDANGVKQTDVGLTEGSNTMNSLVEVTHVDANGDNVRFSLGIGDEGQKAFVSGSQTSVTSTRIYLLGGEWSSSENRVKYPTGAYNGSWEYAESPITFTFDFGGSFQAWPSIPDVDLIATCVSTKGGIGTLEQIIYERQVCAGLTPIDPDADISIPDAKTAIDALAIRYLRENDWTDGSDAPNVNSTLYSDTVASTREALANLALTCVYTVNYNSPTSGGTGIPVIFPSISLSAWHERSTDPQPDEAYLKAQDNWVEAALGGNFAAHTYSHGDYSATGQQKAVWREKFGGSDYFADIMSYGTQIDIARTAGTPIDTYRRKNRFFAKTALPSFRYAGTPTYRAIDGQVYDRAGQEWVPAAVNYWGIMHEDEDWLDLVPSGAVTDTVPNKITDAGTYGHANFAGSFFVPVFDFPVPPGWDVGEDAPYNYDVSVMGWIIAEPVCITEWEFEYTSWDTDDT